MSYGPKSQLCFLSSKFWGALFSLIGIEVLFLVLRVGRSFNAPGLLGLFILSCFPCFLCYRNRIHNPIINIFQFVCTCTFFFLLEIWFRQLRICYFVAPSLTRGQVCNLLYNCFWALPEQSHLGQSPAELTAVFYCLIWDSTNLEGQVPVFISPRNGMAQLYPRAMSSLFVASYNKQGYGRSILTRLHTGKSEIFILYHI
jgi:hypothetical protein